VRGFSDDLCRELAVYAGRDTLCIGALAALWDVLVTVGNFSNQLILARSWVNQLILARSWVNQLISARSSVNQLISARSWINQLISVWTGCL
jgi:hypothetical protein